jgi:hypothetical protein
MSNLETLNSATKYPSIPTYHAMGERGALLPEIVRFPAGAEVVATEKIDGTNARIVLCPRQAPNWLIGSREEWLTAEGDLIANPALGIVKALSAKAASIVQYKGDLLTHLWANAYVAIFGEVFGGKVGAGAKQYTSDGAVDFRVFDVLTIDVPTWEMLRDLTPDKVAAWREAGGQSFLDTGELAIFCGELGLRQVPVRPVPLPESIGSMHELLSAHATSLVTLDSDAGGKAEGLVFRTLDRSVIAKARIEDYERAAKRNKP